MLSTSSNAVRIRFLVLIWGRAAQTTSELRSSTQHSFRVSAKWLASLLWVIVTGHCGFGTRGVGFHLLHVSSARLKSVRLRLFYINRGAVA